MYTCRSNLPSLLFFLSLSLKSTTVSVFYVFLDLTVNRLAVGISGNVARGRAFCRHLQHLCANFRVKISDQALVVEQGAGNVIVRLSISVDEGAVPDTQQGLPCTRVPAFGAFRGKRR